MTATGEQPLDTRLLSDAIIELNISRRNVSIYPRGHSSVVRSLDRAFGHLEQLFDLRDEIAIAVAKDTLIVDESYLDRKNAVYRELAASLSGINIACVVFRRGLTHEELYSFQRLLADDSRHISSEERLDVEKEFELSNISIIPVDYSAFSFDEGASHSGESQKDLWARYVKGLLDGTLHGDEVLDEIRRIPPETLADLLNRSSADSAEESYDEVITTYLRKTSEGLFSGEDLQRLMGVMSRLDPRLKRQFLSSSIKCLSGDIHNVEQAIRDLSSEKVADFLGYINEQHVTVPHTLRALIERFSKLDHEGLKKLGFDEGVVADDFLLSPEVMNLLNEERYEEHIPRSYQEELESILAADLRDGRAKGSEEFRRNWSEERIERDYNRLMLELVGTSIPESLAEAKGRTFSGTLIEQLGLFASIGQYEEILGTLRFLTSASLPAGSAATAAEVLDYTASPGFTALLADSFRAVGRQEREGALRLCRHMGEGIVPVLLDALAEERSQAGRRFLIEIITGMGSAALTHVADRLADNRWYVKRNALYILGKAGAADYAEQVRPYCRDSDARVRYEAVSSLLRLGDQYAANIVREGLASGKSEDVLQAVSIAGSCRASDLVPDLTELLGRKARGRGDYDLKIAVIKALGQIGDRRAMDPMRDILASRSLFFGRGLSALKKETHRVLGKFHAAAGAPGESADDT
jgi:hypothetical protein